MPGQKGDRVEQGWPSTACLNQDRARMDSLLMISRCLSRSADDENISIAH